VQAGTDGYIAFPIRDTSLDTPHAYGVWLTGLTGNARLSLGYSNGSNFVANTLSNNSGTNNEASGMFMPTWTSASPNTYLAEIGNLLGSTDVDFSVVVREVALSGNWDNGSSTTGPAYIEVNVEKWVGARNGSTPASDDWMYFTATGASTTLQFSSLTNGLEITVYETQSDFTTPHHGPTDVCTYDESNNVCNFTFSTVNGTSYHVKLHSEASVVNEVTIGKVLMTAQ